MDKTKICITMPQKVIRKRCIKKQNILVYDKTFPCVEPPKKPNRFVVPPICSANAKKIKVCTVADMKRMCPPQLCACPPKKKPKGFFGHLKTILGFGMKAAIAGGLVYWTHEIGLWGKSDGTRKIYLDLCNTKNCPSKEHAKIMLKCEEHKSSGKKLLDITISDEAISERMHCCKDVPSIRENTNCFKNCWNNFVVKSFDFILDIPCKIQRLFVNSPPPTEHVANQEE